jgi:hypothetical protein
VVLWLFPVHGTAGQQATVWRGVSHCVSAAHPCRDEQVIYRVAAETDSSRRAMSAARIAGADTVDMGPLTLARDVRSNDWVARLPQGVWRFRIGPDSLTGTLTVTDGTVMRRVSASPLRDPQSHPGP